MKFAPLLDYLSGLETFAGRVTAATNLEAAVEKVKTQPHPSCVLFGITEDAQESTVINAIRQRVSVSIRLLVVSRNVNDMRGQAAYEALDDVRAELMAAMLNWAPPEQTLGDDWEPIQYRSGRLAWADAGTLLWLDEFKTTYLSSAIP